jgi:hypothetical protein
MTRKQLSQFSIDELRLLKWRYLEDIQATRLGRDRVALIIKRINQELDYKRTFKHHESTVNF